MSIGMKEKKRQLDMLLNGHHGIKDAYGLLSKFDNFDIKL